MRPKIIIPKRIIVAVLVFLVISGLVRLSDIIAVKQWKREMVRPGLAGKTVIIDPGHGGADPGATLGQVKEAELNMALAQALQKELAKKGVRVKFTRQGDTGLVPEKKMTLFERWLILEKRKKFAVEQKGHILVSIHVNSNPDQRASGGITFYSDEPSRNLAYYIQKQINTLGLRSRQAEQSDFTIITGNPMPSVLVEAGFMTNRHDLRILMEDKASVARAISNGLREYADNL